jgi:hypothetical protein
MRDYRAEVEAWLAELQAELSEVRTERRELDILSHRAREREDRILGQINPLKQLLKSLGESST